MISELTRHDLIDLFGTWSPDPDLAGMIAMAGRGPSPTGIQWSGRLGELAFLQRLYDLSSMPSTDPRYKTAEDDIAQHRLRNYDWDDDWIFSDPRLELHSSDDKLVRFLAETVHPTVRPDRSEAMALVEAYNRILRRDRVQLREVDTISGRPVFGAGPVVPRPVGAVEIAKAIADVISYRYKAYDVPAVCDQHGAPADPDDGNPMNSKARYATRRLAQLPLGSLVSVARLLHEESYDGVLADLLFEIDLGAGTSVGGRVKNLIFGAPDSAKPDLVLQDAVSNDVKIVRNAEHCLVYEEPLDRDIGLSFRALVQLFGQWDRLHRIYCNRYGIEQSKWGSRIRLDTCYILTS